MWPQGKTVLLDLTLNVSARFAVTAHQRVPSYIAYAKYGFVDYPSNSLLVIIIF